jgi:hypothetical protein
MPRSKEIRNKKEYIIKSLILSLMFRLVNKIAIIRMPEKSTPVGKCIKTAKGV